MPQANIAPIRAIYAAFAAGDVPGAEDNPVRSRQYADTLQAARVTRAA